MKPRHQVSRAAIELIKSFEGYRRKAAQLPDGRWTIGYGHTLTAREGAEVSEADAEALLMYDLIQVAHAVNEHSYTPLTQNQFDSLCCFAFNVGVDNFRRSSVLRRVNEGQLLQAAAAMEMWRKADFEGERIVIDALVRRRSAEKTLFLTPANGWVPAPSPVVRPKIDFDAVAAAPRETPTVLKTSTVDDRVVVEREDPAPARPTAPPVEPQAVPLATEVAAAGVGAALAQLLPEPAIAAPQAPQPADPEPVPEDVAIEDLPPAPPPVIEEPVYVSEPEVVVEAREAVVVEIAAEPEPEPGPVMTVVELPTVEVEVEPVVQEPVPTPTPGPILAVVNGDMGFTLTPAPEVTVESAPEDAFRIDLPEPANESSPGLFDVTFAEPIQEGGAARPLMSEDYIRRLVREDEMAEIDGDLSFDTPTEPARIGGLPVLAMGLGGVVLFGGGVAWGMNVPDSLPVALAVSVAGVGLAGFAAWRWLDGLAGAPLDDEDEDNNEEADDQARA